MDDRDNSSTRSTGFQGEEVACRYLRNKGYNILERNYRGGGCEIDIIAAVRGTIVFCEVKTARTVWFGPAISWVTPDKIKHITRAAAEYIATHDTGGSTFRFDVIALDVQNGTVGINHIVNAFAEPEDLPGER